jgi:hypothetical protein
MNAARIDARWAQGLDLRVTPEIEGPLVVGKTILLPVAFLGLGEQRRAEILARLRAELRDE